MMYSIRRKKLIFENGATVPFRYPIQEAIDIEGVIVVCLAIPVDVAIKDNVFGIDHSGHLLWQIRPKAYRYTGLSKQGKLVRAHNFDGMVYDLDPRTGIVLSEELLR